jgi:hypothetical protein
MREKPKAAVDAIGQEPAKWSRRCYGFTLAMQSNTTFRFVSSTA